MIIIPMAGMSSRFYNAGYTKPKYMLEAHGKTLFEHSVLSFKEYFSSKKFLFIIRDIQGTYNFIIDKIKLLGIKDFHITIIDSKTRGQAETVYLGIKDSKYFGPITIFNIDTFRPNFTYPRFDYLGDGYLEVFKGNGTNWSFVKTSDQHSVRVIETAEKMAISDNCCTGLYFFLDSEDYIRSYLEYLTKPVNSWCNSELYIAPLYNLLIEEGKIINIHLVKRNEVIFCGVPEEYEAFLNEET